MKKRNVLIVDDQQMNRELLTKIIQDEYHLLYACNGREALDILFHKPDEIAAVLLDILMPEVDGYEVLRRMRQDEKLQYIPVLVTSQLLEERDEISALSLGAQDYILKPFRPDVVKHRLDNIIRFRETSAMINRIQKDSLTGLYCKEYFVNRVGDILKSNVTGEYDMVYIGINGFKMMNEAYGTRKGNEILRFVGQSIAEFCRAGSLCARFYADNFYVFTKHIGYTADSFRQLLDQLKSCPLTQNVKMQFGILANIDATLEVEGLCNRAEMAGKANANRYSTAPFTFYSETLRERIKSEQFVLSNMETALLQEQFQVYYQPKYDVQRDVIIGAEALVRWFHPQKGFMPAWEFIPLFEKNGFISQMDYFVWEKTCQNIRYWLDQGYPPISVSVNVSRVDIYDQNLVSALVGLVRKYDIPMSSLHLEITESSYAEKPEQILEMVNALHGAGFIIEMDDFGTGYSSLNMLSEIAVDIIKLDMRFIQKEHQRPSGRGIISFIISLARWMGMLIVAEGVETKEQIQFLRTMECNFIQGYYYAKPMPVAEFEDFLRRSVVIPVENEKRYTVDDFPERKPINALAGGKVMLIVDDVAINRAVLVTLFEKDYIIKEVENGEQGWEYLEKNHHRVEIILLDLLMPVMDGFALLEKIRDTESTRNLPVVVTSQNNIDAAHRTLEMRANDYVVKPYDAESVYRRVQNVVESYRYRCLVEEGNVLPRDTLTSLYNRNSFEEKARVLLERNPDACPHSAFLILDLDRFKAVNDTYGHDTGDKVLISVAAAMRGFFGSKAVVGRLGGDEFVALMSNAQNKEEVLGTAEALVKRIAGISAEEGYPFEISCSVGVTIGCNPGDDLSMMYKKADLALYDAKQGGKNRYCLFDAKGKEKILIVDDIEMHRAMLKKALSTEYEVLEAENGAEALRLLKQVNNIRVVVTDIMMPVMDGFELIRQIHADESLKDVAIIAGTQVGETNVENQVLALGVDDFIYKAAAPGIIQMRVKNVMKVRGFL